MLMVILKKIKNKKIITDKSTIEQQNELFKTLFGFVNTNDDHWALNSDLKI